MIEAFFIGLGTTFIVAYMLGRAHGFTDGVHKSWDFHKGLFEARLKDQGTPGGE